MSKCLWLTGLSGSGKTTIACELTKKFQEFQWLDGDNMRACPIGNDVGFTYDDRRKYLLRVGYIAKMLTEHKIVTICSFISPHGHVRNEIREMFKAGDFIEVFVNAPFEECYRRDVKGLYKKAHDGLIKNFAGIDYPYDKPLTPEITVDTHSETIRESVERVISYLSTLR